MGHYSHLTLEEREMIMVLHHEGRRISEIARMMGRDKSTISRELKRNHLWKRVYIASRAQERYETRRLLCRPHMRLENQELFGIVRSRFLEHRWSPEQIAKRIALERPEFRISANTIYRAIRRYMFEDHPLHRGKGVAARLRHKGKRRHGRGNEEKRGKIRISNDLKDRPAEANGRTRLGDWEADTVVGRKGGTCAVTLVDRKSRYLLLGISEVKGAEPVSSRMIELLRNHPVKSVTPDRGTEFAMHGVVTRELGVPFYFPLPHQPWQRGTNENTNGLLREYMPKGCDMGQFTDSEIRWIQNELNMRPRKCLGYRTPFEVFFSESLHLI